MAINAIKQMFRDELIHGFTKKQSIIRDTVTTDFRESGGGVTFAVINNSANTAVGRGANGLIVPRNLNLTQVPVTLSAWYDLAQITDYNIFASQGNLDTQLVDSVMQTINRKIDDNIFSILDTATNVMSSITPNYTNLIKARTRLSNALVGQTGGGMTLLCTPAFWGQLLESPQITSGDYTAARPIDGDNAMWNDDREYYRWMNLRVIVDPTLPGVGTSTESSFLYHKSAIGQAIKTGEMDIDAGYNGEQKYSWASASTFVGSALLQNAGIVKMTSSASGYVNT